MASACGITEDGVAYHIKKLKQSGRITRIEAGLYMVENVGTTQKAVLDFLGIILRQIGMKR